MALLENDLVQMVQRVVLDNRKKELVGDAGDELKVDSSERVTCQQQAECLFCYSASFCVENAEVSKVE